jgi:hypothetical protein
MAYHGSAFSIPPRETKMPDTTYQRFYAALKSFIPESRLATDPLRTLAYGTDASFYRLIPKVVVRADNEGEVSEALKLAGRRVDHPLNHVGCQGRPGEGFRGAHTALGAAGIAAIGDLDHHLSGNTVVQNGSEDLAQGIPFSLGLTACFFHGLSIVTVRPR